MKMNKKIAGSLLTVVLSISAFSTQAFAQVKPIDASTDSRLNTIDPDVNPYADPSVPGSGVALSMDTVNMDPNNIGVTSTTGSVLSNEQNYNKSQLRTEEMQKDNMDPQNMDQQPMDQTQQPTDMNKDMTGTTTTNGSGTVNGTDLNSIDILSKYNSRVSDCIDELSRANGDVVKNDAFFACQRYKIN